MNLAHLQSFIAIAESGSLSRTAERMRVSQSTLSRQIQALEEEIGGRVFERSRSGVALTAAGQALFQRARGVLEQFEAAIAEARKTARGQTAVLRIGYLMSTATDFLNPVLTQLRAQHPTVKVKLVDLSPGEQIAALRRGELDVALTGNVDASLSREFYVKRLARLPVVVALPDGHPLATRKAVRLADLRRELFVGAKDADLPGHNQWITRLCRRARFRPQFVEDADNLTQALGLLVAENAVTFLPALTTKTPAPGVTCRPLDEPAAHWDLQVAWQRGRLSEAAAALIDALTARAAKSGMAASPR